MRIRLAVLVLLVALVNLPFASAKDLEVLRKSFVGQTPPEIVSEKDHWMGPSPPTDLSRLAGKVVWLQFNF